MSKYYGKVGFVFPSIETAPGVWDLQVEEKNFYGEILQNTRRWQGADKVNDDVTINERISILGTDYAFSHYGLIRYAELKGIRWNVTSVTLQYPRITLELGSVYTGRLPGGEDDTT